MSNNNRNEQEKKLILSLKQKYNFDNASDVINVYRWLQTNGYKFVTKDGVDFDNMLYEKVNAIKKNGSLTKPEVKNDVSITNKGSFKRIDYDKELEREIKHQMKQREKKRKTLILVCLAVIVISLGYFGYYYYIADRTQDKMEELAEKVDNSAYSGQMSLMTHTEIVINDNGEKEEVTLHILEKYSDLYMENNDLIGWLKIEGTDIDYPVLQCDDSEFYLNHDFYKEKNKNGSIFLDSDCNVVDRDINLIIYGHHMKSGNMFGNLDRYSNYKYFKEHPIIQFDTIYEEGTYEIMYVFRSKIYTEDEIRFKYYQFINANSAEEFDSYMNEMASMSLYDTGIRAGFGDELITLSTCDYQEKNGRFVVVAKKIQ